MVLFAKKAFNIHEPCPEATNGTKNGQKPSKKRCFFGPSGQLAQFVRICCATDTEKLSQLARGAKKHLFLEGFRPFFVPLVASGQGSCILNAFFAKRTNQIDLFWPQKCHLQSSAAYRGSPLPALSTDKYKRQSRAICYPARAKPKHFIIAQNQSSVLAKYVKMYRSNKSV